MDALRPYAGVFAIRVRMLLQYRAAALAGFATQCWWGAMRVMVLTAFYRSGPAGHTISLAQSITYVWLGQALLTLLPWSVDGETTRLVRTGDVAYERLRPVDTYAFWLSRSLARRTAQPLMRAIPMVLVAGILAHLVGLGRWGLGPPAGVAAGLLFALSLACAVALSAALSALMETITAAALSERGVQMLSTPVVLFLSGNIVPLPLFPDWAQPLLIAQPIAGLVDIPSRIWFGQLSGSAALAGIGLQLFWVLAFSALGHWLMGKVMRRLQVQGG